MRICATSLICIVCACWAFAASPEQAKTPETRVVTPTAGAARAQAADAGQADNKKAPAAATASATNEPVVKAPAPAVQPPAWWKDLGYGREEATPKASVPSETAPETFPSVETPPDSSTLEMALQALKWLCVTLLLFFLGALLLRSVGKKAKLLPRAELAEVIGRVYLAQRVSLHFVRTGGRVLVVGVNQNAINLIADFDAAAYDHLSEASGAKADPEKSNRNRAQRFLEELRAQQGKMNGDAGYMPSADEDTQDAEIASLRGDIARLQRLLREASHDPNR